jgi:hypothetical protein
MFDLDATVVAPASQLLVHACRHQWTDFEIAKIRNIDDDDDFSSSSSNITRVNIACLPDIDDLAMPDHRSTRTDLPCVE